jgi:hypothetical protein
MMKEVRSQRSVVRKKKKAENYTKMPASHAFLRRSESGLTAVIATAALCGPLYYTTI